MKLMKIEDKEIKEKVKKLLRSYRELEKRMDQIQNLNIISISDEEELINLGNTLYFIDDAIEESINDVNKDTVVGFLLDKEKIEAYEERLIKKEIERLYYTLAKKLGYLKEEEGR